MDSQVFILNEKRNVTLTAYLQDDSQEFWRAKKRPAVVIFPGGAYAYCSDREADPVAQEYLRAGYHTFVLRYSVGWENAVWPNPLEDYDQAMELIAAHAKEWHLIPEKIGRRTSGSVRSDDGEAPSGCGDFGISGHFRRAGSNLRKGCAGRRQGGGQSDLSLFYRSDRNGYHGIGDEQPSFCRSAV